MSRLPPLGREEWPTAFVETIESYRANVRGAKPAVNSQSGNNLFGVFAYHPELINAFLKFNGYLLSRSSLTLRDRELMILRVAFLQKCEYEWAQHVIIAGRAEISDAEIARVRDEPDSPEWTDVERALLGSVDDLLDGGKIRDDNWAVLSKNFDTQQCMDLLYTVGCYSMLAMVMRSLDVTPEEGLVAYLPSNW
ncbi:carboxymuconolactone decarboxylase family protein [Rhodococcus sp. USK13]|uniref:carboxymuconolactone decarboxylase family protein n=1 Tax=Rhodococcus sp. USK13 TaxID=2806442 RepID=UPI001BD0F4D9|nr:carboxymuconolactone decarboxylase family protein [Rhodococcus sp. USK13]